MRMFVLDHSIEGSRPTLVDFGAVALDDGGHM